MCSGKEEYFLFFLVFGQIKDLLHLKKEHFRGDFVTLISAEHFSHHVLQGSCENVSILTVDELQFFKPFDLQATSGFDRDDHYTVPEHVFVYNDYCIFDLPWFY